MAKETRETIIQREIDQGILDEKCIAFYNLSHEEKAKPEVFENFCAEYNGHRAILLSDDQICGNKELVLIAAKYGFWADFHFLSNELLNDPDIALALANCNRYEYTSINRSLRDDPVLMLKAVKINPSIYLSLTAKVKADRNIVKVIAQTDTSQLRFLLEVRKELREPLLNDKEIAMLVAKKAPEYLFAFFSEKILSDNDILEMAFQFSNYSIFRTKIKGNYWALKYIDANYWKNDKSLIKAAVKENGMLLQNLPIELKDDKEIVLLALQEDTEGILEYASTRLQDDYDVVKQSLKVDGLNLAYASERMQDNRDLVLLAIKEYGGALSYASERLQRDEELNKIARMRM